MDIIVKRWAHPAQHADNDFQKCLPDGTYGNDVNTTKLAAQTNSDEMLTPSVLTGG